jgi:glyoxylase-like metal-dependent hydrolase (beta-lactamase superfamily II)
VRSALLLLVACANARVVIPKGSGPAIGTIPLKLSNVHVVFGEHPMLVDTGTHGELDGIEDGLHALGARLADVRCAVVTHVHADHAGTAFALQQRGIKIIAGAGDVDRARRGYHGRLTPTSFAARTLRWFIPSEFEPFTPDVAVTDRYDLAPCGVAGEVLATPGHTPGSLVVLVAGGSIALVGDMFRGGLVDPSSPAEHFYQDDLAMVHRRIRDLLGRAPRIEWFVLGHGGPVLHDAVAEHFGEALIAPPIAPATTP